MITVSNLASPEVFTHKVRETEAGSLGLGELISFMPVVVE